MKTSKVFLTALSLAAGLTVSLAGYASLADCSSNGTGGYVHCAFTSGNGESWQTFKMTFNGETETECLPNNFAITIAQDDASYSPIGRNMWTIDECSDPTCAQTKRIATDVFGLAQHETQGYVATPPTFSFTVDDNFGQGCSSSSSKSVISFGHVKIVK